MGVFGRELGLPETGAADDDHGPALRDGFRDGGKLEVAADEGCAEGVGPAVPVVRTAATATATTAAGSTTTAAGTTKSTIDGIAQM
ncbi:MAG: hypothetical protein AAB289_14115, partial [Chloroflexota bacterium]